MQVGTLTVVEGSLKFDKFKELLLSHLGSFPKFRQRLMNVPFNLGYPVWVDDPNFDIDLHFQRVRLPEPADWRELRQLTTSIFSRPLDMRRPLWSVTIIEGIDNIPQIPKGSVAILAKIHHVMIDGMSGMGLMEKLFSPFPDWQPEPDPDQKPYEPEPLPDNVKLVIKSTADYLKNPMKLPKMAGGVLYDQVKNMAFDKLNSVNEMAKGGMKAPRSIFNGSISSKRTWGVAILDLDRIKNLRMGRDVTINDLILAICSGGIRKYLEDKDKLPSQSLIANVPISVRDSNDGELNNQISNMLVPIATQIEDPIERLETIHEHTVRGKMNNKAAGAKSLTDMASALPFGLANLAADFYSRYNLKELHSPPFNVTISNVPGPQVPLYIMGHKVESILGLAPVLDGFGLIITILSYNGRVFITATSDAKTMPDADLFARLIRESANELEECIQKDHKKQAKQKEVWKSEEFFKNLKEHAKKKASSFSGLGKVLFSINGNGTVGQWGLDASNEKPTFKKESITKPGVTVTISDEHLAAIAKGDLTFEEAQLQGRLKLDGSAAAQKKLAKLFSSISKA